MKAIKYSHLTLDQRSHIEELVSSGFSLRQIGRKLGISASTVCRELKRNSDKGYNYIQAEQLSIARRHEASANFKKLKGKVEERILECLQKTWSPEQISGRLKLEGISISHEAIYQYVRKKDLRLTLRHGGKKYKAKKAKEAGVNCIPGRVDISERPSVVDEKLRIGDWEGDTVISHGSHCALMTLVDRHSKYTIIQKIGRKTADNLNAAAIKALKKLKLPVYSITFDNGKEFAKHQELAKKLGTKVYFARPYKSCDRGLNEHTNGLIRQFLPKKFDFKNTTDYDIKIIQDLLNSRPRKSLNYRAPVEVILDSKNTTGVAVHS